MELETILRALKYSAIAIATGSAIWGMVSKLTYEDHGGRRQLTQAGKITIGILVVGFFVSVASNYLQEELARQSAQSTAERDTQRTQEIILSATPLRQLTVKWRFDRVPPKLHQEIKAATGIPEEWNEKFNQLEAGEAYIAKRLLHRHYALYPWLTVLDNGVRWAKTPTVLLIALDESAANVLPLGVLSLSRIRAEDDDPKKAALRAAQVKALASTVEFTEELEGFFRKRLPERTRLCELDAKLVSEPPVVSTEWNLNPGCMAKGIDRADSSVGPVARLPERITLHLFTRIDELPFNPGNLTESDKGLPWVRSIHRPQRPKADDFRSQSSLELIPNGLAAHRAVYQVQYVGTEDLRALGGGAEVIHRYGRLSLWEGRRQ